MDEGCSKWIEVAQAAEIPEGALKEVSAGFERIVIANHAGKFYAFEAKCPHMGGPLGEGTLVGAQIDCPWHHYLYDIATGENYYPKSVYPTELKHNVKPLRTFPVRVIDGRVKVKLSG